MPVQTYPKHAKVKLNDHFISSEFNCPCTNCNETLINTDLVAGLERMREALGVPLRINSGYRCAEYQHALSLRGYETAIGTSQHTLGNAADVMSASDFGATTGADLANAARHAANFMAIGTGHGWIHVDTRTDKFRNWEYKTR